MNEIVMNTQDELQEQGRTIGKLKKQIEDFEVSKSGESSKDQEIKALQEKLRQMSEEIDKSHQTTKTVPVFDSSKYDVQIQELTDKVKLAEEEIRKRNARLEEQKAEIIELKKNNKIQRREIETLQNKSSGLKMP